LKELDLATTIIAVATPPGQGALGIVRLSGAEALAIAQKIFRTNNGQSLRPWQLTPGRLVDWEKEEAFDEATAVYFQAPRSYTREDMVEIICHGSPVILEAVVRLGIKAGARMAHAGEFTLRAYLHGRVDLLQAEAVNDLIRATSLRQARLSFRQLGGQLSGRLGRLRQELIHLLSQVEATIEFPEEGIELDRTSLRAQISSIMADIEKLIRSYELGQALLQGIKIAIVGRANVGKSTLFNALLERERAIVSPYPGTTRDYLEEKIKINDSIFTLVDMAGLDQPAHPVEAEGIRRARSLATQANGLLILLDVSQPLSESDQEIISLAEGKKAIFVLNKIDLPSRLEKERLRPWALGRPIIEISALNGVNLEGLKQAIAEVFAVNIDESQEEVIFHWREKAALEAIDESLRKALFHLESDSSEEIIAEELRQAAHLLGELTGEIKSEEIINAIFSQFCLGK